MTGYFSRRIVTFAVLAMLLASSACSDSPRTAHKLAGETMGTTYHIQVFATSPEHDPAQLKSQITGVLAAIEQSMSTYIKNSEVSRFNGYSGTDWFEVSSELCATVAAAQQLSATTDGAFDVTVGPLVNLWGFGPQLAFAEPPEATQIESVLRRTGYELLRVDCSRPALAKHDAALQIDLSAYAKGYGVDRIAQLLDQLGMQHYLVEIGGELRTAGLNSQQQPWSIGIETPRRDRRAFRLAVELADQAMATSGDYRNFFEHDGVYYSHMIDPRTGSPVTHNAAAVTVIADTAATADGMATAMLVLGPDEGLQLAERQQLAAMFQIRSDRGDIRERRSSQFSRLVARQ